MGKFVKKLKGCRCFITIELYDKFVQKARAEGFSIQKALAALISNYVEDKVTIKGIE